MSCRIVLGIALLATLPTGVSFAVTVTDNFDSSFDYLPGSVPGGGIWTRVLNPGAGGGLNQDPPVDPVPVFDANSTNAGSLTMSTFGVGFGGGGATTAPALVREVDADLLREVRVHVTSQTAGQWSQAGILIRAPGPIDTLGPNDNFFTYGGFRSGGADFGGDGIAATTQNVVNGGEAEMNADAATLADVEYLRVVHLGTGDFETYTSPDGSTWTQRQTFLNTGLATGTIEVGLWGGSFAGSNIVGGASAAFDYIQIDEAPDAPEASVSWAAAGSGDWNRSNWSVVGGKPDSNISVAVLGAGAPLTAAATVYTNQNNTVKQLQFDNATFGYTVAGPGTLTLDADTGNALIDVLSGTHEIQVDLILNDNTTATAAVGTTLNINAPVYLNGHTFTVTPGGGTVNLNNGTFAGGGGGGSGAFVNEGNVADLGGVEGDFAQSGGGSLAYVLGSDPIQIDGDAILDGVLDISLGDGFAAKAGEVYTVLTADSVTDLGLALGGEGAGLFELLVSGGSVSLVGAVPEPGTCALVAIGLAAGAMLRRRRISPGRRGIESSSSWKRKCVLAVALTALSASSSYAQFGTFRDDFGDDLNPHAQQWNYEPGPVFGFDPLATSGRAIWNGTHNSMNGGGPFGDPPSTVHADFVADGFNFAGTPKPGHLLMEDLVLHPNTDMSTGVGWEAGNTNAPMLFREVPANANLIVTMKIDAQTSGNWSYTPIIARLKMPAGAAMPTPVGFGPGDTLPPEESFVTMGSFRTNAADNLAAAILTQGVVNGAGVPDIVTDGPQENGLPLYIQMRKTGGLFEMYASIDGGMTYAFRNSIINAELNQAGEILQVGPSYMSFNSAGAAVPGNAEIDFFEITVVDAPPPLNAYWRPIASLGGSGNFNDANNWQCIESPGCTPIDVTTAHFHDGDSVPTSGDVRVTGPVTVFNNAAVVVKGLDFKSANQYSIGGSGSIAMQGDLANVNDIPTIDVQQGSHEIDLDMQLLRNTTLTSVAGTRLDFNNTFDFGALNRQLNVNGAGRVNFNSMINTAANGVVNVNSGATVGGSGRINGTVNNNAGGTVAPGTSTGTLTIDGQYIQNAAATLAIEIGGTAAGTFDKLIAPLVTLNNGTLSVSLVNGFVPQNSDVFEIVDATSTLTTNTRFGNTPGNVLTTSLGTFTVTYDYTTDFVRLSNFMFTGLPGDHNGDGKVDTADYVAWRKNPSAFGGDPAGYNTWRTNFGSMSAGSGGSTGVPEPGTIGLVLITIAMVVGQRRYVEKAGSNCCSRSPRATG